MKKRLTLWVALALVLALMTTFVACTPEEPTPGPGPDDTTPGTTATVTLDKTSATLELGDTAQLTATKENTEEVITWTSADPSVATVSDSGLVSAVKVGKTVITATAGAASATCEITVIDSGTVPVMTVSDNSVAVSKDATIDVTAAVKYKGETVENVEFTWAVAGGFSNSIASIDANGATAAIKGLAYGSTAFTVSATVRGTLLTETIYVDVRNTDVTLEVEGLELGSDGKYTAKVALAETENDKAAITPIVKVYNKNVLVENATVEWTIGDNTIVSYENGVITALKVGTTTITGNAEGNFVTINVIAYKPTVEISGDVFIETMTGGKIAIPADITYPVTGITLAGKNVLDTIANGEATLKDLPNNKDDMGETSLTIDTAKISYKINAFVCHRAIRTAEDLDNWGTWAKSLNEAFNLWDGYFVLANDIEYNKTYTPFISYAVLGDNAPGGFNNGRENGFMGVFDGRGHTVKGMEIGAWSTGAFIGTLHTNGVIRNVSFINGIHNGPDSGYLVMGGNGTIENVYIQLDYQSGGNAVPAHTCTGGLISGDCMGETRVRNVIVDTKIVEGAQNAYGLGSFHLGYGILNNVYCIGTTNAIRVLSNAGTGDIYGGYATLADFQAANINFADWDKDFWTILNGVPYPKNIVENVKVDINVTDTLVASGSTVAILGVGSGDIITVDAAAAAAGVTINGSSIVIPATVANDTKITVTVTSGLDSTKSDSIELTVRSATHVNAGSFGDIETYTENVTIDIGAKKSEIEGTLVSLVIGDKNISGATYADGVFTIPSAQVISAGYETKAFVATFNTKNGDTVTEITTVTFDGFVITKILKTKEDINTWYQIASTIPGSNTVYYGGYFVLGNDIAFNDAHTPQTNWFTYDAAGKGDWSDMASLGFCGVFDGRGYNIDGMRIEGDQAGGAFITILSNTGIIRNISFTNASYSGTNSGFICFNGAGRLENIYIQANYHGTEPSATRRNGLLVASDCWGALRVVNCFVDTKLLDDAGSNTSALGSYHEGYGTLNNVYAVGTTKGWIQLTIDPTGTMNVAGAYATYADLKAAGIDFSSWEGDFWTVIDGAPYPKKLINSVTVDANVGNSVVGSGETVQINNVNLEKETITLDDASIAAGVTLDGSKVIIPTTVGTGTKITVTVTSKINTAKSVSIVLTVENITVTDAGNLGDVETYGETTSVQLGIYDGVFAGLECDGAPINNATYADGILTIPSAQLAALGYETKHLVAVFEVKDGEKVLSATKVNFELFVITKVLKTADDISNWYNLSKATPGSNEILHGGYFVLGNDIAYNSVYDPPVTWHLYNSLGKDNVWAIVDGRDASGFYGTFDGRGYNIEGLKIENWKGGGAFITKLHPNGVIKNISFTNASMGGLDAGFLVYNAAGGTIENVYIQCVSHGIEDATAAHRHNGLLIANDTLGGVRVENCIVETNIPADAGANTTALGSFHNGYGVLNGVYAIGTTKAYYELSVGDGQMNVVGGYASYADLKAAGIDFSSWEGDFWAVSAGVPYPKNLIGSISVNASVGSTTVAAGSSVEISGVSLMKEIISIDADSYLAGVTVNGTAVVIPENIATDTVIAVKVSNSVNPLKATTILLTVKNIKEIDAGNLGDVETYTENATINLGSYEGTFVSLSSGSTPITGVTYENGILSIPSSQLLAVGYETKNFVASFEIKEGDKVISITNVSFDAFVLTKVLKTKDDLNTWTSVALTVPGSQAHLYGGYFVLGNDIAYNGQLIPETNWFTYDQLGYGAGDWSNGRVCGFYGVFDGRGYNIDGMEIVGDQAGGAFITTLAASGKIRNISFTNAKYSAQNTGYLCFSGCGEIRNVYIHCIEQGYDTSNRNMGLLIANDCMGETRLYNCFVETTVIAGATSNSSILGSYHLGYGILNGVYGVGNAGAINVLSDGGGNNDIYGAYATYAALKAAGIDFSSWEGDFWTVINGIPYPKKLKFVGTDVIASVSTNDVAKESEVTINGVSRYEYVSLAEAVENVSISGNKVIIGDVALGTVIKVNITNIFDSTKTKQIVLTVKASQRVVLDGELGNTFTNGIYTIPSFKVLDDTNAEVEGAVVNVTAVDQFGNELVITGNSVALQYAGIHKITIKWELDAEFVIATNIEKTFEIRNTDGTLVGMDATGITLLDPVTYDPNVELKISGETYNGAPVIEIKPIDIWSGNNIQSGVILPYIDLSTIDYIEFYAKTNYVQGEGVALRAGTWWGYSQNITNEWQLVRFPVSAATDLPDGRVVLWIVMDNSTSALGSTVYISGVKALKYNETTIVEATTAGMGQVVKQEYVANSPVIADGVTFNGAPVFAMDFKSPVYTEIYGGMKVASNVVGQYQYIEFWVKTDKAPVAATISGGAFWTLANSNITNEWQKLRIDTSKIAWDADGGFSLWFFSTSAAIADENITIYVSPIVGIGY